MPSDLMSAHETPEENSRSFSLILLGTETFLESETQILGGYERGETLNGLFHCLGGENFKDKHIAHGPETWGTDTNVRALEGLLMILKAISEGKTTFKIAAHSRGAIEALLIVNSLHKILDCLKKSETDTSKALANLQSLDLGYMTPAFKGVIPASNNLTFSSQQIKLNRTKDAVKTEHSIDMAQLIANIRNFEIQANMFLIDPVPGQYTKTLSCWSEPEFYNVPDLVKKLCIIYARDERTAFFDPVIPKGNQTTKREIITLPGHHGTASGWFNEQAIENSQKVATEKKAEKLATKLTRHVQNLVATKLVTFFGAEAFPKSEAEEKQALPKSLRSIRTIIKKRVEQTKQGLDLKDIIFRLYEKIKGRDHAYRDLIKNVYPNLEYFSSEIRYVKDDHDKNKTPFASHPEISQPPDGAINYEHMRLLVERNPSESLFTIVNQMSTGYQKNDTPDFIRALYRTEWTEAGKENKYAEFYKLADSFISTRVDYLVYPEDKLMQASVYSEIANLSKHVTDLLSEIKKFETSKKISPNQQHASKVESSWKNMKEEKLNRVINNLENELRDISQKLNEQNLAFDSLLVECQQFMQKLNRFHALLIKLSTMDWVDKQFSAQQMERCLALQADGSKLCEQVSAHVAEALREAKAILEHQAEEFKKNREAATAEYALKTQQQDQRAAELKKDNNDLHEDLSKSNQLCEESKQNSLYKPRHGVHLSISGVDDLFPGLEERYKKNPNHPNIILTLKTFRNQLVMDMDKQRDAGEEQLESSTAVKIAGYYSEMLTSLRKDDLNQEDAIEIIKTFEQNCKQTSHWEKFRKGLCMVCFAVVGLVAGALIGMGVAALAGLLCGGPTAFVTAAIGCASGAVAGGLVGLAGGFYLFKPKAFENESSVLAAELKECIISPSEGL